MIELNKANVENEVLCFVCKQGVGKYQWYAYDNDEKRAWHYDPEYCGFYRNSLFLLQKDLES
jgi:hypothetical protein